MVALYCIVLFLSGAAAESALMLGQSGEAQVKGEDADVITWAGNAERVRVTADGDMVLKNGMVYKETSGRVDVAQMAHNGEFPNSPWIRIAQMPSSKNVKCTAKLTWEWFGGAAKHGTATINTLAFAPYAGGDSYAFIETETVCD